MREEDEKIKRERERIYNVLKYEASPTMNRGKMKAEMHVHGSTNPVNAFKIVSPRGT